MSVYYSCGKARYTDQYKTGGNWDKYETFQKTLTAVPTKVWVTGIRKGSINVLKNIFVLHLQSIFQISFSPF